MEEISLKAFGEDLRRSHPPDLPNAPAASVGQPSGLYQKISAPKGPFRKPPSGGRSGFDKEEGEISGRKIFLIIGRKIS